MFGVQINLMLGSPKPDKIQSNGERNRWPANECSTTRNRHTSEFVVSGEILWWVADSFLYLHIFKSADCPEVVCEVVVRDVVVRHGEVAFDTPVHAPGVADEQTPG